MAGKFVARPKYGNKKVTVDGIVFDSKREAKRYAELKLLERAVERGIPKEDARYITPQAACTSFLVTMNARELRHFFALRCCERAQWEIRDLANQMLALCKNAAPKLFDDAGPGCVRGSCPEGKMSCGHPKKGAQNG